MEVIARGEENAGEEESCLRGYWMEGVVGTGKRGKRGGESDLVLEGGPWKLESLDTPVCVCVCACVCVRVCKLCVCV